MASQYLKASVRDWTDLLSRCQFGTVTIAGKNLTSAKIKAVAMRLAMYADSDGSRVRPGIARLAVDLEIDPGTAKRVVQHLTHVGLLQLVRPGVRPGHADEYQLVFPEDLLEHVVVWTPAEHGREVERIRARLRGRSRSKPAGRPDPDPTPLQVPETPADNEPYGSPEDPQGQTCGSRTHPQNPAAATDLRVPERPQKTDLRVPQGLTCGSLRDPPPTKDLDTTTTEPTHNALRTDLAVVGHPQAEQDQISEVVDEPPSAPCPHGIPPGRLRCPACSRGLTDPPPDAQRLAPVIPIRRAS